MLDDAVDAFLDSITERAFDEPLLAIARAQGFTHLHLVHGSREFGRDAIGRRDGKQWAWQSKAGDINQSDWRTIVGQLDELRTVYLGHGAFDVDLPRHPVLVTTGRLKGNVPDLYRDYNIRARERGEPELDLWDRDVLLGFLSGNPDAILRNSMDGQFLAVLGAVDERTVSMSSIEMFSRRWTTWEPERLAGLGVVEASVVCERLRRADRVDLACHLGLCFVRGAWAAGTGGTPRAQVSDAGGALFEVYARQLWDECDDRLLREKGLVGFSGYSAWVTYPVRCIRVAEVLGLLALRLRTRDREKSDEISRWLVEFARAQPGVAHPIGDRYAVSLLPAALALASADPAEARSVLHHAVLWLCDAYDAGRLGLAGVDAEPVEEVERLLGSPFEFVTHPRRRSSLIATVLLDLAWSLGLDDLYRDAHNDIRAVEIRPWILRLDDGLTQYVKTSDGNRVDPNVNFAEAIDDNGAVAPHHDDIAGHELAEQGREWDLLAVSAALRDRYFVQALRIFGVGQ